MKTSMQELIEQLKEERDLHGYEKQGYFETAIELAEAMLEKEEEVMCEFATAYTAQDQFKLSSKDYYDETFKTKER